MKNFCPCLLCKSNNYLNNFTFILIAKLFVEKKIVCFFYEYFLQGPHDEIIKRNKNTKFIQYILLNEELIRYFFCIKQGRKRPLDTPKRMIERRDKRRERKKGRRRDIERKGEIREIEREKEKERGERDREVKVDFSQRCLNIFNKINKMQLFV